MSSQSIVNMCYYFFQSWTTKGVGVVPSPQCGVVLGPPPSPIMPEENVGREGFTTALLFAWNPDLFFRGACSLCEGPRALAPDVPQTCPRAHFCVCRCLSGWFRVTVSACVFVPTLSGILMLEQQVTMSPPTGHLRK